MDITTQGLSRRTFVAGAAAAGAAIAASGVPAAFASEQAAAAPEAKTVAQLPTSGPGNSGLAPIVDGEVGGVATFSGGRRRPEPHTGHPSPMTCGYVGPDAMPILPVEAPDTWDAEVELVVVGAGYGGLTAACYAAQEGHSVILCEKNPETGGASAHSAFNASMVGGTKRQIENGYFFASDTFDFHAIVNKLSNAYGNSIDLGLLRAAVTASPVWFDWMLDKQHAEWALQGSTYGSIDMMNGITHAIEGNRYATDLLTANATEAGADIRLKCEVTALVVQDGRVVGVQAENRDDGSVVYLRGERGVILTAGCFGMNMDLLEQYCPVAYIQASTGGPMPWATGECFRMGLGVGADVSGYNSWSGWDGASDEYWGGGDGNYWHYFWSGERQLAKNPWMLVDKDCNRLPFYLGSGSSVVPGSEVQPGFDVPTESMGDLTNCAAWMASRGNRNYCIFDDDFRTNIWNFVSTSTLEALDRGRIPHHPGDNVVSAYVTEDWVGEFELAIERGAAYKADTLEELAELVGLDPEKLVAHTDEWNRIVASGDDSAFTPQYMPDWLVPVQKPPFYCIPCSAQIAKVMCGLRVNGGLQVLTADFTPIEGLYAGFFTAGGICGESDYGGVFGNPSLACGAAMSGIGGLMAVRSALGDPITEADWCEEARALNDAAKAKASEAYMASYVDDAYLQGQTIPQILSNGPEGGSATDRVIGDDLTPDPAGPYADGEYVGRGVGIGGPIEVALEINDGRITVLDIAPNNETKGIGGAEAIMDGTYKQAVEAAQGSAIDGIAGATVTTNAIRAAVRDALGQAAQA